MNPAKRRLLGPAAAALLFAAVGAAGAAAQTFGAAGADAALGARLGALRRAAAAAKRADHSVFREKQYTITHDVYPRYQTVYFGDRYRRVSDGRYMDDGVAGLGSARGFKAVEKRLVPGRDVLLVINNSGGGEVKLFHQLGEKLRAACRQGGRRTCTVTTYVTERCDSACVDLYMFGDRRYARKSAVFGFHRAYIELFRKRLPVKSAKQMAGVYVANGASRSWFMSHLDLFDAAKDGIVSLSGRDLLDAGVVSRFSNVAVEDFRMAHGDVFDAETMRYIRMERAAN